MVAAAGEYTTLAPFFYVVLFRKLENEQQQTNFDFLPAPGLSFISTFVWFCQPGCSRLISLFP